MVLAVLAIGTIKKREIDILALVIMCALVLAVLAIGTIIKKRERDILALVIVCALVLAVLAIGTKREREFLMCCPFWLVPNKEKREREWFPWVTLTAPLLGRAIA